MDTRRARPRLWNTDWVQLRALSRVLHAAFSGVAPGATVVDLGCGDMPYRTTITALGHNYKGADIDAGADLLIGSDGRVNLSDASAEVVLSVQVLEHVRDLDAYCAEIRRLLKPGGTLFLSTHGTWLYHPHPEDHWRWTRTGLIAALIDRGLAVENILGLVGPLATTTTIRLTGFAWTLRRLPLLGGLLAGLLAIVMNLRALVEEAVTPAGIRHDNACIYWVRARVAGQ
jgi:SAM-dependent methyltransferase